MPATCRQPTSPGGPACRSRPCGNCAKELRAKYLPEARQVEAPDYEPKMNATPNAVATKE